VVAAVSFRKRKDANSNRFVPCHTGVFVAWLRYSLSDSSWITFTYSVAPSWSWFGA
jgi:hypothetical protein